MSGTNGDHKPATPLAHIEQRISARQQEEAEEASDTLIPPPPLVPTDEDPLVAWKRRYPGQPVTLEQIHAGLIATCEYSEAAIEGGIKMAADVHEIVKTVEVRSHQIAMLTAKVESSSVFLHKVDEEMAASGKKLNEVRRDVQNLKDDMREVKEATKQIPVIKDLLGEILARLPEKV